MRGRNRRLCRGLRISPWGAPMLERTVDDVTLPVALVAEVIGNLCRWWNGEVSWSSGGTERQSCSQWNGLRRSCLVVPDVRGGSGGDAPQRRLALVWPSSGPVGKLLGVQLWSDSWQDVFRINHYLINIQGHNMRESCMKTNSRHYQWLMFCFVDIEHIHTGRYGN